MTYEKRIEKAKALLEKIMDPEATMTQSVKDYKAGMEELQKAQKLIEEAKAEIETVEQEHGDGTA